MTKIGAKKGAKREPKWSKKGAQKKETKKVVKMRGRWTEASKNEGGKGREKRDGLTE